MTTIGCDRLVFARNKGVLVKQVDDGAANIKAQVQQGFIVRTAVDRNLVEAYHNYVYRVQQFATVGTAC